MTLVVDGMPSSGGPRCLGGRGVRFFASAAGAALLASAVTSVKGSGSSTPPAAPSCKTVSQSNVDSDRRGNPQQCLVRLRGHDHLVHDHDRDRGQRISSRLLQQCRQHLLHQHRDQACGQAEPRPCARGFLGPKGWKWPSPPLQMSSDRQRRTQQGGWCEG